MAFIAHCNKLGKPFCYGICAITIKTVSRLLDFWLEVCYYVKSFAIALSRLPLADKNKQSLKALSFFHLNHHQLFCRRPK